jgi:hypothetical protein
MKILLTILTMFTAIQAYDNRPVIRVDITKDSSFYTSQIANRITEILVMTLDYRVISENSLEMANAIPVQEKSESFDKPRIGEFGRFLTTGTLFALVSQRDCMTTRSRYFI